MLHFFVLSPQLEKPFVLQRRAITPKTYNVFLRTLCMDMFILIQLCLKFNSGPPTQNERSVNNPWLSDQLKYHLDVIM